MIKLLKRVFWSVLGIWRIGRYVELRVRRFNRLLHEEQHTPTGIPLGKRIWAIRNGFYSSRVVMYGLTPENIHNYVPDILLERLHPVNGRFSKLIDGKFPLMFTLRDFPDLLPEVFYLVRDRIAFGLAPDLPNCQRYEPRLILELLDRHGRIFVKPESGSGGNGALLIEKRSNAWFINGRSCTGQRVQELLTTLDDHLIGECVEQHPYARNLFAGSANTVRLTSIRDDDKLQPTFISAFQRVGTSSSQPADNIAAGGLYGRIDLASGELGKFARYPKTAKMEWYSHHPETGAQLEGVMVPRWNEIKNRILEVSRRLSFISLMGYDVVLTQSGMKILEINSMPTVLPQAWEPLLLNPAASAFFEKRIPKLRRFKHQNSAFSAPGAASSSTAAANRN